MQNFDKAQEWKCNSFLLKILPDTLEILRFKDEWFKALAFVNQKYFIFLLGFLTM